MTLETKILSTETSDFLKIIIFLKLLNSVFYTGWYIHSILFHPITFEGRWGTADVLATIPFLLVLFQPP